MYINKISSLVWCLLLGLIVAAFIFVAAFRTDPDFGWHLKTGELILSLRNVPKTDPYSYTMPSFAYVDHAWFSDVVWALLYPHVGMVGLGVLYGGMIGLLIIIALYPKFDISSLLPVLYAAPMFFLRFGVRTQVIDWVLFAIFLRLMAIRKRHSKYFGLVLIMWLWANLHGGFVVGLVIWLVKIFSELIFAKKIDKREIFAWILALGSSVINPYGLGLWTEVYMTLWGNQMRLYIVEWMPALFTFEPAFIFGGVLVLFGVWRYRYRIELWKTLTVIFLMGQALMSTRHVALVAVMMLFLWPQLVGLFQKEFFKDEIAKTRSKIFYGILLIVSAVVAVWIIGNFVASVARDPNRESFYPIAAVEYLRRHPFDGNLYSEYGWGGYLIWHYPQKKTFVDGRMAIWRRDIAPEGETTSAFKDAIDISKGNIQPYFSKYGVTKVLWPKSKSLQGIKINLPISNFIKEKFNIQNKKSFEDKLLDMGWKKEYEDDVATIYSESE